MKNEYDRKLVEKLLDEIMENFDFKKVHNVMEFLDWKWASSTTADAVPSIDEIKDEAARLLWDVVNDPENEVIATGGLRVTKDFSDYRHPFISLEFVLEEWDAVS